MSRTNDRFNEDFASIEKNERQINDLLRDRNLKLKAGEPTGSVDYQLRSRLDNIKNEMKNMEKQAYLYQNDAVKYADMPSKEREKRIKQINALKARTDELGVQIRLALEGGSSQPTTTTNTYSNATTNNGVDLEARPLIKRGEDGEFEDTRNLNNKQILQKQRDMIKDQDKHLDEIGGIVKNIKYDNENFNEEITHQNKMLTKLGTDMDRTHNKMVKVDNKLKELIAKSNQCTLWIIIIIEIAVLLLVIFI